MSILEIVLLIVALFWGTIFAVIGIYNVTRMLGDMMAVRKGAFRVIFRLPNNRIQKKLIKPDKESVKVGDKIYSFTNGAGYVYYEGSTPIIEYDVNGNQINFLDKIEKTTLDPEGLNSLFFRIYNAGKASAMKTDTTQMLLIAIIVTNLIAIGFGFINMETTSRIAASLP